MRESWYSCFKTTSLLIGLIIIIIGNLVWSMLIEQSGTLFIAVLVQYTTPLIASFVAIYFDGNKPVIKTIILGCISALGFGVVNLGFEASGRHVDFHGYGGALLIVALTLPVCLLLSAIGVAAGCILKKILKRNG